MSPATTVQLLLLFLWLPYRLDASSGDRSSVFLDCVYRCSTTGCITRFHGVGEPACPAACAAKFPGVGRNAAIREGGEGGAAAVPAEATAIPLPLRFFRWSCEDDCKYHCMRTIEGLKASVAGSRYRHHQVVEKYYGKWPFVRVLGMQELVSVLASFANLLAHLICLARLWAAVRRHAQSPLLLVTAAGANSAALAYSGTMYPFLALWGTYSAVHMNAWFWSMVFHSRDTKVTERFDYIGAILVVGFSFFTGAARILWGPQRKHKLCVAGLGACVAALLACHMYYMFRIKFDYGWNMKVCATVGIMTAIMWMGYYVRTLHPARYKMCLFVALLYGGILLEVLDFPPVSGLLDAHASWHIATAFITPLFYHCLQIDAALLAHKHKELFAKDI